MLQVGALYALYCLYQLQPGRTRVYLPLPALEQILALVPQLRANGQHGTDLPPVMLASSGFKVMGADAPEHMQLIDAYHRLQMRWRC